MTDELTLVNPTAAEFDRLALRSFVRGAYALQNTRIRLGQRLVAQKKARMGVVPGEKEDGTLSPEDQKLLGKMTAEYGRLTDKLLKHPTPTKFKGTPLISTHCELSLTRQYVLALENEKSEFRMLAGLLKQYPLWTEYLVDVKGCGPAMAAVIISEINIHKAEYVSSLWKYCGLDVAKDGAGRSRRQEHLVDRNYTTREGKAATCKGLTYKSVVKTKLIGVLAGSFLRTKNEEYSQIYNDYKHRLENHKVYGIHNDGKIVPHGKREVYVSKGHRHYMALRYMIKMFLKDLYKVWREQEGLVVNPPYQEAKLGHVHGTRV